MPKKLKMPGAKTKVIRWAGTKKKAAVKVRRVQVKEEKPVEEAGLINGRQAGSLNEWRIAKALWKYGWSFRFQVPVMSGTRLAGGQVLDFLVDTQPAQTALEVDGGYWHSNSKKEEIDDIRLIQALRNEGYSVRGEVLHAFDGDSETQEDADRFIYSAFGRS